MPSICQYQIVELDTNISRRREICIHRCQRSLLFGQALDLGNPACDFSSRGDNQLVECVHRLREFPVDWLANFANPHFLVESHFKRRASRHHQRNRIWLRNRTYLRRGRKRGNGFLWTTSQSLSQALAIAGEQEKNREEGKGGFHYS